MLNSELSKLANIWANRRSEKNGVVYYTFSEKALDAFAREIIVRCVRACIIEQADPRDTVEGQCAARIVRYFEE